MLLVTFKFGFEHNGFFRGKMNLYIIYGPSYYLLKIGPHINNGKGIPSFYKKKQSKITGTGRILKTRLGVCCASRKKPTSATNS
jgi:hypothetical protein